MHAAAAGRARGRRYPRYLPADPGAFVTSHQEFAACVAVNRDGRVIGHVALHDAAGDPTLELAERRTGRSADHLAVVARLLVAPDSRRAGLGGAPLAVATEHARSIRRRAVLDVVQDSAAPIALYEATGWTRLEEPLRLALEDGRHLDLWFYVAPE